MARRVRYFATQVERDPIPIRPPFDSAPLSAVGSCAAQMMDDLDVTLSKHESQLLEMNSAYEVLGECLAELIKARHVLRETAVFSRRVEASQSEIRSSFDDSLVPLLQHDDREDQYSS